MNDSILSAPPLLVFSGRVEEAVYRDPLIPTYRGNPFVEALPPIWTVEETAKLLMHYPDYAECDRTQPSELRLHLIQNAVQFFEPLPVHLDLEQRFSRVIRASYQARNPVRSCFWRDMHGRIQALGQSDVAQTSARSPAVGFTLLGISGIGKTTAVEAILSLYPQVIFHSHYHDQNFNWVQVVWLKLDCPFDGSTRGFCMNFFQAMDSILGTYYFDRCGRRGRATTDEMMPHMGRVCSIHGLGVLVIDEIQHLSEAKSGGSSKMLNFFVQLVNTIGVPVIPVGTYKALSLLTGEFRQARRGTGQGDLVWDRMVENDIWQLFVESLWRYQYVHHPSPLTLELSHVLYDVSQGITDFAVKAYMLAQIRAITTGEECVRENLIRSVAADSFRLANPVLLALKKGDTQALLNVEDVHPIRLDSYMQNALTNARPVNPIGLRNVLEGNSTQETPTAESDQAASATAAEGLGPIPKDAAAQTDTRSKERRRATLSQEALPEIVFRRAESKLTAYEVLQPIYIRPAAEFVTEGV